MSLTLRCQHISIVRSQEQVEVWFTPRRPTHESSSSLLNKPDVHNIHCSRYSRLSVSLAPEHQPGLRWDINTSIQSYQKLTRTKCFLHTHTYAKPSWLTIHLDNVQPGARVMVPQQKKKKKKETNQDKHGRKKDTTRAAGWQSYKFKNQKTIRLWWSKQKEQKQKTKSNSLRWNQHNVMPTRLFLWNTQIIECRWEEYWYKRLYPKCKKPSSNR